MAIFLLVLSQIIEEWLTTPLDVNGQGQNMRLSIDSEESCRGRKT